ncbi:MAG: hypothetical protein KKF44_01030 [Nanoarchaeota archaeon]|nr:hypothetical protein [Nanoarchaeota archaeon]
MYIYLLSKEDLDLSLFEVLSLGEINKFELNGNMLLINKKVDYEMLAYTKKIFKVICKSEINQIKQKISEIDMKKNYEKSFCIRCLKTDECTNLPSENEVASIVWKSIEKPIVNLKTPHTKLYLIGTAKMAFFCKEIWENKQKFDDRRAHLRPELHPTSLNPKLARAFVNILNKKSFLDPFCGSGGILIEGGLVGCKVTGYDIDPIMIRRSEINLKHYGIKKYILELKDATTINDKVEGIITDLPYGRNSKLENFKIYDQFLKVARKVTNRMIVSLPADVDLEKHLPSLSDWKVEKEFTHYLHKSLSKRTILITY